MIEVKNIHKTFGDNHVLKDVSFTFQSGKTNLVIGASGSGKTTLIKCMVG
ncbi:MAG: ATP-binding cassette domain-containing protein, partial [Flavobacteriales bacterium]